MAFSCYRCSEWPCVCRDGITLIHGDCREVLQELGNVAITVSSPPYNTLPTSHAPSGIHAERKAVWPLVLAPLAFQKLFLLDAGRWFAAGFARRRCFQFI